MEKNYKFSWKKGQTQYIFKVQVLGARQKYLFGSKWKSLTRIRIRKGMQM